MFKSEVRHSPCCINLGPIHVSLDRLLQPVCCSQCVPASVLQPVLCKFSVFVLVCRTLSCAACCGVSDVGISCLSSCRQLCDLNTSYCDMACPAVMLYIHTLLFSWYSIVLYTWGNITLLCSVNMKFTVDVLFLSSTYEGY